MRRLETVLPARFSACVALVFSALVFGALYLSGAVRAQAQMPTIEPWKKLTIIIGSTPSGGFDRYGRILARHIGKYLPGHPDVIAANKPGAGGMIAYNYIYNLAPKDGSEIGISAPGNVIDELVTGDKSNAKYNPEKFTWIGVVDQETAVFVAASGKGISVKDLEAGKEMQVGMVGMGGNSGVYGRALRDMLGFKIKLVAGYAGMPQVMLAFERGEIDGIPAANWAQLKSMKGEWFKAGKADVILQYGSKRDPDLANVPMVREIIKDPGEREAMDVFTALEQMSRPVFGPPGMAPERVAALRAAFVAAMQDPDMIAEIEQSLLGHNWLGGADLAALVSKITHPTPAALRKIQQLAGN